VGGSFTTVSSALQSITDNDASNPYLIMVGPGTYPEQVTMKSYVDIEGSGVGITIISQDGAKKNTDATVVGASNAELRLLTVRNGGSNASRSVGIYSDGASIVLRSVTVSVDSEIEAVGVWHSNQGTTRIYNSRIHSVRCDSGATVYVNQSQVTNGTTSTGDSAILLSNVYDTDMVPVENITTFEEDTTVTKSLDASHVGIIFTKQNSQANTLTIDLPGAAPENKGWRYTITDIGSANSVVLKKGGSAWGTTGSFSGSIGSYQTVTVVSDGSDWHWISGGGQ